MPGPHPMINPPPLHPPAAAGSAGGIGDPLLGVAALVGFHHAGVQLANAFGLRLPGAVLGLVLLAATLHWVPPLKRLLGESAGILLRHLPLMIIPAGVGVMKLEVNGHWLMFTAACMLAWLGAICLTALALDRLMRRSWRGDSA